MTFPKAWTNMRAGLMAILTAGSGFILLLLVSRSLGPPELATFNVLWALIFSISGIFNGASLYVVGRLSGNKTKPVLVDSSAVKTSAAPAFALFAMGAAVMVFSVTNFVWNAGPSSLTLSEQRIQYVALTCVISIIQLYLYTLCLGSGKARGAVTVLYFMEAAYRLAGIALSLALFTNEDSLYISLTASAGLSLASTIFFMRSKNIGFWPLLNARPLRLLRILVITSIGSLASVLLMVGLPAILSFNGGFMQEPESTELLSVFGIFRAPVLLPINFLLGLFVAFAAENREVVQGVVKKATLLVATVAASLAVAVFFLHDSIMAIMFPTLLERHISAFIVSMLVLGAGSLGVFTLRVSSYLAAGRNITYTSLWWVCCVAQVGALLATSDVEAIALSLIMVPLLVLFGNNLISRFYRNSTTRN